jgi:hypothetical protein
MAILRSFLAVALGVSLTVGSTSRKLHSIRLTASHTAPGMVTRDACSQPIKC